MPHATAHDDWIDIETAATRDGWPMLCCPNHDFQTPQLKRLLDVWQEKRGAAAMPARASLSLRDMKFAAANIGIVAVVREPDRMRFEIRIMGSELERHMAPMAGQFIDEAVPAPLAAKWTTMWTAIVERKKPLRAIGLLEFNDQRWLLWETLHAPLATDGETPDALLVAIYYYPRDHREAAPESVVARLAAELGERATRAGVTQRLIAWLDRA